jgi:hypothetical protein
LSGFESQSLSGYDQLVRLLRWALWLLFFAVATFCWVVLIEHGPENFAEGAAIELENLKAHFGK